MRANLFMSGTTLPDSELVVIIGRVVGEEVSSGSEGVDDAVGVSVGSEEGGSGGAEEEEGVGSSVGASVGSGGGFGRTWKLMRMVELASTLK